MNAKIKKLVSVLAALCLTIPLFPITSVHAATAITSPCTIKSYVSTVANPTPAASVYAAKGDTVYVDIYLGNTVFPSDTSGVVVCTVRMQYDAENFDIANPSSGDTLIQGTKGIDYEMGSGVPAIWDCIQFVKGGSGSTAYLQLTYANPAYYGNTLITTNEVQTFRLIFKAKSTATVGAKDFTFISSEGAELKTYLTTNDGKNYAMEPNSGTHYSLTKTDSKVEIKIKNTVSFDSKGGSAVSPVTDFAISTEPVTSRANYTFDGWYSDITYATKVIFPYKIAGDTTLYAKWSAASTGDPGGYTTYTLTYDKNGATSGSVPADNGSYLNGTAATVIGNTGSLVKKGNTFSGWNTKADGTGTSYAEGSKITFGAASIVLYAVWSQSISYNNEDWLSGNQNNYIVAYYKESGKILPLSYYDEKTGYVNYRAKNPVGILAKYNFVPFSDISDDFWAGEYIWFMSSRTIINGMGDGTYQPESNVTRAQFVKILASMVDGIDIDSYPSAGFADVKGGQWYEKYIDWAFSCKIVDGYGNGNFGPNYPLTREQMCCIIDRFVTYLNYKIQEDSGLAPYADEGSIDAWALKSVKRLQGSGLVNGKPNNQFDPLEKSTRAEAATIACRLLRAIIIGMESNGRVQWTT